MNYRFAVGEVAVYGGFVGWWASHNGTECEIVRRGPFPIGEFLTGPYAPGFSGGTGFDDDDYEVRDQDGCHWFVQEKYLRKRCPPEEPAEKEFQLELERMLKGKVEA